MKNDVLMYEKVYGILKNKIQCGLIPPGAKLPSRAALCREFNASEKTIRHAMKLLVEDGLVQSSKRRRPTVSFDAGAGDRKMLLEADFAADDILKTGVLLFHPVNRRGMALCSGQEWEIPETIVRNMDPDKPIEFWGLSSRVWRFFIARNENELILRVMDHLGFSELDPVSGAREIRQNYRTDLLKLIQAMKNGRNPENAELKHLFSLLGYQIASQKQEMALQVTPDSLARVGTEKLEPRMRKAQERYSSVYMDLLGLIAIGRYQPGDRLPSHAELCDIYKVSVDTTIKAIRILQEWGIVTAVRGRGIFVAKALEALKQIQMDPDLMACHVRRYIDSLELLSLTFEGVAVHAAASVTPGEARRLKEDIEYQWTDGYLYQCSPVIMLDFVTEHIQYNALKAVYNVVRKNYHIGRSIPKLVTKEKTPGSRAIYSQCAEAADCLLEGEQKGFAQKAAAMFQNTRQMVIKKCKKMGYWDAAMRVYDGRALWR